MRMEKAVKIVTVHPYVERTYTDKNGESKVWKSKGFTIRHGSSQIYAEANGNVAEALKDFQPTDNLYIAYLTFKVREFNANDGSVRYSNEVSLDKLVEY